MSENSFNNYLFWDVNVLTLDMQKHAQFIIERVIQRGTIEDWKNLNHIYTKRKIKNACIKAHYLDKLTLNFCSVIFRTPKEKFKCYINQQSNPNCWNY